MKDEIIILIRKWFKSKTGIDLIHDPSLISLANEIEALRIHDVLHDWEMFKVFAKLHPVEAYDSRPDDFCKFMRGEGYDLNNEQIKELVDSSR